MYDQFFQLLEPLELPEDKPQILGSIQDNATSIRQRLLNELNPLRYQEVPLIDLKSTSGKSNFDSSKKIQRNNSIYDNFVS